jgi:phage gp29-like protein
MLDSAPYRASGENQSPASTYQWDVELLRGDNGPHDSVAAAIERLNREMARILGVEQLLLGSDSKGSHALAQDKTQSFGLLVDSTLREIRELYERDFLDPLWELNGWDKKLKPKFQTSQAQYRDVTDITTALKDMATAGAPLSLDDPTINEVRDLLGLSAAPDTDLSISEDVAGEVDIPGMEKIAPRQGEGRDKFLSRFMEEMVEEYPDREQRYAVALSYWRRK